MNMDNNNSSQEIFQIQKEDNINNNIIENKENELSSIKNNNIMNEKDINNNINNGRVDLITYIMNRRKKLYHRLEGMEPEDAEDDEDPEEKEEPEEESSTHNEQINLNNINKPHYGNIGSNIVLFNKWVIGIKKNIILFIITLIGMSLTWFGWILTCDNYYSKKLYIICSISFFFTNFFMILSFIIEPGIIPRKCPEFLRKDEFKDIENKTNNEINNYNDNNNIENKINEEKNIDENKEIKEKKINKKIKEKKNEEIIPRIFRERECITCNIIRPPGASHCRICDNCVLGFDHHCYYISNCVGKRNHKFFYYFLFFGTISGIEESFFISITFFHVFIIKANETIFIMYKSDKFFFILSSILMSIALIYLYCGVRDILCLLIPALIGFILFVILWYKNIYILKNIPNYYNPYILIVFISSISFFLFVLSAFMSQTIHICSGYTIKQNKSIINEIIDLSYTDNNNKINKEYTRNKTFKEKINNLFKFLKTDIEKSLIIPERDLFKKK